MWLLDKIKSMARNASLDERFQRYRSVTSEAGRRGTQESQLRALYLQQQPDYELYAVINEIRQMDKVDGHVKQIHSRTAKALTKGGLILDNPNKDEQLAKIWKQFMIRCQLKNRLKLISDARGLIVEGNLPMQWVLNTDHTAVVRAIRMPSETIRALSGVDGQITDPATAYAQYSHLDSKDIATFASWQLYLARIDPENYDDAGSFGRPLLDATRKRWRQMMMQQEDMVIRRRTRAPLRTAHVLKGATNEKLAEYKQQTESEEGEITNNYYMNTDGAVTAIQGDANLEQIADVALMMDSFFAGTPMPKALLGYVDGLSRDVLTDMKEEFYDELDTLQDSLASVYTHGFTLELLLHGINPDAHTFEVKYGERLTETLNSRADRALKFAAVGASRHTVWTTAGLDAAAEAARKEEERKEIDAYPQSAIPGIDDMGDLDERFDSTTRVSITPGNAGKGESATSISN